LLNRAVDVFIRFYPVFFAGLRMTLILSALTVILGTAIGSLICLCRMSKFKPLSLLATAYIEIIRGTPLLLQLVFFYYAVPEIIGYDPGKFASVLMALVLNSSGYVAEIIRAGIQAVDKGQTEAARSLGLNPSQTMMKVVFPQAIKNILPTLGNEFVMVIKETSLASNFFLGDLMTSVSIIKSATYSTIEPLIVAGVIYFACTFPLSKIIALYERRLATSD